MNRDERYYVLQERVRLQTYLDSLNPEHFRQLQQKTKNERAAKIKASVDNIDPVLVKYYLISIQKGSSMDLGVMTSEEYRKVLDTKVQAQLTILKLHEISI
ncbi:MULTISPECIES: hypothetical protein [Bacillus cereus group]|uniref:hypothetical protein n=1 Tax=Bacillus cereus group TaxID=86661 RepID=UPI0014837D5D|nr:MULTISPECIES: hypothetical protein [Bacillus cereus group]MCU4969897.1 hypothetical protein [Bacillus toyonensis]HDR7384289.1 hypothetical protein [Bacillus toyonensis]HDR7391790.1 hypothetical protein [Bacillus toyonensis]